MRRVGFTVACGLWATVAAAQPLCESVFLPDLNGPITEAVTQIPTQVLVPPVTETLNSEGLYPFHVITAANGDVAIRQTVGHPSKAYRVWTGIRQVSLVFWMHAFDLWPYQGQEWFLGGDGQAHVWQKDAVYLVGYKTLPTSQPPGQQTGAYRTTQRMTGVQENFALSSPVQLGEQWNMAIVNTHPVGLWVHLQIEARVCR